MDATLEQTAVILISSLCYLGRQQQQQQISEIIQTKTLRVHAHNKRKINVQYVL